MKINKYKILASLLLVVMVLLFVLPTGTGYAQTPPEPPPPTPPPGLPIDGGIGLLIAAGLFFGIKNKVKKN